MQDSKPSIRYFSCPKDPISLRLPDLKLLLLLLLVLSVLAGCTEAPPEGTPIDFTSARVFKPFKLRDLDGNQKGLEEFLSEATLVAFFFPT